MEEKIPVHRAIARALCDIGVETMFGLMGDANLFMVDAFVREQKGRYVGASHEANAVMMALGYASLTGRVGAATVTQGPGISNAITPLIDGVKGTLPIVLLCGDMAPGDTEHPQWVAHRALVEAAGAGLHQLRSPETVGEDVAAAFHRARVERRPIVLNMPTAMMWDQAAYTPPPTVNAPGRSAPAVDDALNDAIGVIAAARRPIILAGRGATHARDKLIELADRIGAPLATTLKAKGLFAGAPFDLGVFGTLSTPAAEDAIGASDCIIAFGAGLNRFTTARGGHVEGRRLIQIDDDPRQIGRRQSPDAALIGDPGLVAETLIHWLDEAEIPSSQATDTLDPAALVAPHPKPKPANAPGTIDISKAMERIDQRLDPDRIFVTDGGRFLQDAWSRISVTSPANMLLSVNTGAIGLGLGYAIGAAVARPDQMVLLVTGDGGFMMGGVNEFATAVREKAKMVVILCNDNAYGAEYVQFQDRQMDPALSTFDWPSFADIARALGGRGAVVRNDADLEDALDHVAGEGPLLIELMIDPAAVPRIHF